MSRLVVDSCVAIKWFVDEPGSYQAAELLDSHRQGQVQLLAPDFIFVEICSVLWSRFHRHLATAEEVQEAFEEFRSLPMPMMATGVLLDDALQLALRHDRSPYDCLYLALSVREQCPFVTADKKFYHAVRSSFPQVILLEEDPQR